MPSFGGPSPFMKLFEERSKGEKGGGGGATGKGGKDVGRGSRRDNDDEGRKRKKGTSHGAGEALEETENLGGKVEASKGKKRGGGDEEANVQQLPSKKKQKKEGEARREQARGDRGSHGTAGGPLIGSSRDDNDNEVWKGSVASAGGAGGLGVEGKKKRKKRKGRHGGNKGFGAGDARNEESDEEDDEDGFRRNIPKSGNLNGQQKHGAGGGGKDAGPLGHEEGAGGGDAGDGKKKREWKNHGGSREATGEEDDGWGGGGQGKDKAKNVSNGEYPFEADDADHAETPVEAYRDIAPVLARLAEALGKTKATLRVYDPYYCAGGVVKRLAQHGFKKVYNRCEDFYKMIETVRVLLHSLGRLSLCGARNFSSSQGAQFPRLPSNRALWRKQSHAFFLRVMHFCAYPCRQPRAWKFRALHTHTHTHTHTYIYICMYVCIDR